MGNSRTLSGLAVGLGLVALIGCSKPEPPAPPPPPEVIVATPVKRDVTRVYAFTGTTQAIKAVEIRARVQGYLDQIKFEPSTYVKAGQVLFVIEQEPFIARRDRAKAALESAEAALRVAESDLERLEQAVKTNAVSQQEVTRARAQRDQADAGLSGARSELQNAEIELAYTTIETPIDGLISRHLVDAGNLVGRAGGETVLTTVRQMDPIYANFEMDERRFAQILALRDGHDDSPKRVEDQVPAKLRLLQTGLEIEGFIDSIDNKVDTATGTIMVRATFPNPKALIFPGFYVQVQLPGEVLEDAIVVDERAIGTDMSGKYVYVVGEGDVVELVYVKLGPRQEDGTVVVREGLKGNERYIAEGLLRARPGRPVTPKTGSGGA